ncbi:Por secretion system C-terminal sorting domain-containing protein, partial [Reichenbachiella agariperforans]
YTATVTSELNGCSISESVVVGFDFDQPNIATQTSGLINCLDGGVTLSASSTSDNVSFSWTDENGDIIATEANTVVSEPGNYTATVTSELNGCSISESVEVISSCTDQNTRSNSLLNSIPEVEVKLDYSIYPNPSRDQVTVSFSSPKSGHASVEVYSLTGYLVSILMDDYLEADTRRELVFNKGRNLQSGVYIYIIRLNDYVITDRIVISK